MKKNLTLVIAGMMVLFISITVFSILSNRLWSSKSEKIDVPGAVFLNSEMTLREFGQKNSISNPVMKKIFDLKNPSEMEKKILSYGSESAIKAMVIRKMALISEEASKNWQKIVLKFGLWFIFLIFVFFYFKKRKVTRGVRYFFQITSILIFGIILGADPGPMGTVKDAIVLFAKSGAVFIPRIVALGLFLLMVIVFNKYICSWGCQAGVLQDFLFRWNQTGQNKPIIWKQFKPSFAVTNTIRIISVAALITGAFLWGFDIIEPFDIFKVYNPLHLGIVGAVFVGLISIASLFIYRPWCHLFCPFGLVGWLLEKVSIIKIRVDYSSCIACRKCSDACPSTVMGAILEREKKIIPDCFSCYSCRDVCPTGSISFSAGKRDKPPQGHFTKKQ